jgi:hypothetical protein
LPASKLARTASGFVPISIAPMRPRASRKRRSGPNRHCALWAWSAARGVSAPDSPGRGGALDFCDGAMPGLASCGLGSQAKSTHATMKPPRPGVTRIISPFSACPSAHARQRTAGVADRATDYTWSSPRFTVG